MELELLEMDISIRIMGIFILERLKKINLTDTGSINILMVLFMLVNSKKEMNLSRLKAVVMARTSTSL